VGAASFGGGRAPLLAPTRRRSEPHPSSTLRAVARRRGGGCRGARCRRLALLVVLVVPFGVVVVILWLWSTREPPDEQWLVGVATSIFHPSSTPRAVAHGAGGGWFWGRSLALLVPAVIHSPYPPCKQTLAAVGMGGGSALSWDPVSAGFGCVSVTWRAYGGCYVLTRRVAPFWGLPASLCALLACVNNLTSRLNREEGDWLAACVRSAFFVVAGRYW
jgi:hypothetical protein